MQLSNLKKSTAWYFFFGAPQKSSLQVHFASDQGILLLNPKTTTESTFKDNINCRLIAECSPALFRQAEKLKPDIFVVLVGSSLSLEQQAIGKEYVRLGRAVHLKTADYKTMRKELHPKLIILFGPNKSRLEFFLHNYFNFSSFHVLHSPLTANELVSGLPKDQNYILTNFVPESSEVSILEDFYNVQIVHVRYERTELNGHQDFFDLQARVVPGIQKKAGYCAVKGATYPQMATAIGAHILPDLIYVNSANQDERQSFSQFAERQDAVVLSLPQIEETYKRRNVALKVGTERVQELVGLIYRNIGRKQLFLTDYPQKPQDFFLLREKTRALSLFADCLRPDRYDYSPHLTPAIYYLETQTRRAIDLATPFEKQISTTTKYLLVSGPPCVGKTSAAKYLSSLGYRHIEYEPYLASVKDKLIAPQDGEDLPFAKLIKHFNAVIAAGNSPLVIDGLPLEAKHMDAWLKANGAPTVFNLRVAERELIRRTRRKNQADVNGQPNEEQTLKARQNLSKNNDWIDHLSTRCPSAVIHRIDFSDQLLVGEKLLQSIVRPRVYLVQTNSSYLFQNVAIRYGLGYFDLRTSTISEVIAAVRKGNYRSVLLNGYGYSQHLVCEDFSGIEKNIGAIRYLAVWNQESAEVNEELLYLEPPAKVEKPKVEGEEGEPPAAQEEVKKGFSIYDYDWSKVGSEKNMSQWLFKLKKKVARFERSEEKCFEGFAEVLQAIDKDPALTVYEAIAK